MQFWGKKKKISTFHRLQYSTKILWGLADPKVMSEGNPCLKDRENIFIFQAVCMSYFFYESGRPLLSWVEKEWLKIDFTGLGWTPTLGLSSESPFLHYLRACLIYTVYLLLNNFHWSQWELCAWSQGQNLAQTEYNSSSAFPNEIHLESDMHSWMQ